MDLELICLFPKSDEMKRKATRLVRFLVDIENGVNQRQASAILRLNEMDVSRLCDKLEAYGYIMRKRTDDGNILMTNF